jgi:hypothetical protein
MCHCVIKQLQDTNTSGCPTCTRHATLAEVVHVRVAVAHLRDGQSYEPFAVYAGDRKACVIILCDVPSTRQPFPKDVVQDLPDNIQLSLRFVSSHAREI